MKKIFLFIMILVVSNANATSKEIFGLNYALGLDISSYELVGIEVDNQIKLHVSMTVVDEFCKKPDMMKYTSCKPPGESYEVYEDFEYTITDDQLIINDQVCGTVKKLGWFGAFTHGYDAKIELNESCNLKMVHNDRIYYNKDGSRFQSTGFILNI
mgnify:CR=1 FL=1